MQIVGKQNKYFPFDPYNFHYISEKGSTKPQIINNCATVAFKSVGPHLNYMVPTESRVPQQHQTSYLICSMQIPEEIVFSEIVKQMMFRKRSRSWLKVCHNPKSIPTKDGSIQQGTKRDPSALDLLALVAQCFIDPAASWGRLNPVRSKHQAITLDEIPLLSKGALCVLDEVATLVPEKLKSGMWRRHDSIVSTFMGASQLEEALSYRTGLTVDECQAVLYAMRQCLLDLHIDAAALGLSLFEYEFLGTFAVKGAVKNGQLQTTCALTSLFKRTLRAHIREWRKELGLIDDDDNVDMSDEDENDADL